MNGQQIVGDFIEVSGVTVHYTVTSGSRSLSHEVAHEIAEAVQRAIAGQPA